MDLRDNIVPTVLYVEDEVNDTFLMRYAFVKQNVMATLQVVPNGRAALAYLRGSGQYSARDKFPVPAVILLDLNLPEVHGFEVLAWIRKHPVSRDLPVVIFSSSALAEDQDRAQKLGADVYWQKPNSLHDYMGLVNQLKDRWLVQNGNGGSAIRHHRVPAPSRLRAA